MPKFKEKNIGILSNQLYFDVFEERGVKSLRIRKTVDFKNLKGREFDILSEHVWTHGDSLLKLSFKFFGKQDFWWVIGLVNNKPTDAHYKIGDIVYLPSSPYQIVELMK